MVTPNFYFRYRKVLHFLVHSSFFRKTFRFTFSWIAIMWKKEYPLTHTKMWRWTENKLKSYSTFFQNRFSYILSKTYIMGIWNIRIINETLNFGRIIFALVASERARLPPNLFFTFECIVTLPTKYQHFRYNFRSCFVTPIPP